MKIEPSKLGVEIFERFGQKPLIKGVNSLIRLIETNFATAERYELQLIRNALGYYYYEFEEKFGLKVIPEELLTNQVNTPEKSNFVSDKQVVKTKNRKKNKK